MTPPKIRGLGGRYSGSKGTVILHCTCLSQYQDQAHGRGNRVHNVTSDAARCANCGSEKK